MKQFIALIMIMSFSVPAYGGIITNGANDSTSFAFCLWDSTGNSTVALASGDSVWLTIFYPNGQYCYKDSTDYNDTEITGSTSSSFTTYTWRDDVTDIDGTPVYGASYHWEIIAKDLTSAATETRTTGEFTILPNFIDDYDGTGYAGGTINRDVNVAAMDNNVITNTKIATGALAADEFATSGVEKITHNIWGHAADTAWGAGSLGDSAKGWGATAAGGDDTPSNWDAADSAIVRDLVWIADLTDYDGDDDSTAGFLLFVAGDSSQWASVSDVWGDTADSPGERERQLIDGGTGASNWSDAQRDSVLAVIADAGKIGIILDTLQLYDDWIAQHGTSTEILDTLKSQDDWIGNIRYSHADSILKLRGLHIRGTTGSDTAFIAAGYGAGIGGLFKGGATNGHGLYGLGVGDGAGFSAVGGSAGNSNGFAAIGYGTGHGIYAAAGLTGHGAYFYGGSTSGIGLKARGRGTGVGALFQGGETNGDGLWLLKQGTGLDLNAPLFIDAIFDEDTTGHNTAKSFGLMLKDTTAYQGAASGLTVESITHGVWGHAADTGWAAGSMGDSAKGWGATSESGLDSGAVYGAVVQFHEDSLADANLTQWVGQAISDPVLVDGVRVPRTSVRGWRGEKVAVLGADSTVKASVPDSVAGMVSKVDSTLKSVGWDAHYGGPTYLTTLQEKIGDDWLIVESNLYTWLDSIFMTLGWDTSDLQGKINSLVGGMGANACSIYAKSGSDYLQSVHMRLQSSGGTDYYASTNSSGLATFALDDGTYYGYATVSGYSQDVIPDTFTFTAAYNDTLLMTAHSVSAASAPNMVNAYIYTYDLIGDTVVGARMEITPNGRPPFRDTDSNVVMIPSLVSAYSNTDGLVQKEIVRSSGATDLNGNEVTYNFKITKGNYFSALFENRTAPDSTTWHIK